MSENAIVPEILPADLNAKIRERQARPGRGSNLAEPGVRRVGRPKGSKNKATKTIEATLARLECDPVSVLARIASNKKMDPVVRVNAAGKLLPYLYPQRKAIEVSNAGGEPFMFQFVGIGETIINAADDGDSEADDE